MEECRCREQPPSSNEGVFRISVSLERYFSDERALCYMMVPARRRVRWLRRRLRQLFPLPPRPARLALLCRGHLLPPDERLALLRPDDQVQVIPVTTTHDQETCASFSNKSMIEDKAEITDKCCFNTEDCNEIHQSDMSVTTIEHTNVTSDAVDSGSPGTLDLAKQRVLALLDEVGAVPRKRRRRVRRRRAPRAHDAPDASAAPEVPDVPPLMQDVSDVPDVPDVSDVPDGPDVPDVPDLPDMPDAIDTPASPVPSDVPDTAAREWSSAGPAEPCSVSGVVSSPPPEATSVGAASAWRSCAALAARAPPRLVRSLDAPRDTRITIGDNIS